MAELLLDMLHDPDDCFLGSSNLTVTKLRTRLGQEGLDVDGSKETLISRLNESNKRKRTE